MGELPLRHWPQWPTRDVAYGFLPRINARKDMEEGSNKTSNDSISNNNFRETASDSVAEFWLNVFNKLLQPLSALPRTA